MWRGPLHYSWVINGSDSPLGPDLSVVFRHFADPRVRADLESIGVPDPFAFLSHFVLGNDGAERFAGAGPIVTDDRTRLDFSVPRSVDSFYGFSNSNAGNWMVEYMGPQLGKDIGLRFFFQKIAWGNSFKEPVLPHLTNIEGSGLSVEQLRERLAAAGARTDGRPDPPRPADRSS